MSEIRVYVEGGGDGGAGRAAIRQGFGQFLNPLRERARRLQVRWSVVPCGSRHSTFADFRTALRAHRDAFNILLVDAEEAVSGTSWEHLRRRQECQDVRLPDEHGHLMAQTVEAWLIADPEVMETFYGQGFQASALPGRRNVEEIGKADLLAAIDRAVRGTRKGSYDKISHGAALLARLRPERVRPRAPHCERLFATLEQLLGQP